MPASNRGPIRTLLAPLAAAWRAAGWVRGAAGMQKSFRENPILGSPALNRRGLHRARVRLAAALSERRRRRLARTLPREDVEAIERDGFVVKHDWLARDRFAALRDELLAGALPAHEMRQGQTVTRVVPIVSFAGPRLPIATAISEDRALRALIGYAAGRAGAPAWFLQTVLADPDREAPDPQTTLHADTFHATAKAWLFLHDVGEDDGPLTVVPGSHRLTERRLEWEHRQSLTARDDPRLHHALGSFRLTDADFDELGLREPREMTVPANTLVVADTFGFHARKASARPTLRMELHGGLRRNPFVPWNGLDWHGAPGIRTRQFALFLALEHVVERLGKPSIWHDVGAVRLDAPARI